MENSYWCERCQKRHFEDSPLYLDHLRFGSGRQSFREADLLEELRERMEKLAVGKGLRLTDGDLHQNETLPVAKWVVIFSPWPG
jgi:hypothetical protein